MKFAWLNLNHPSYLLVMNKRSQATEQKKTTFIILVKK